MACAPKTRDRFAVFVPRPTPKSIPVLAYEKKGKDSSTNNSAHNNKNLNLFFYYTRQTAFGLSGHLSTHIHRPPRTRARLIRVYLFFLGEETQQRKE